MRRFIITESEADLTSHAGLGLIGLALNERTDLGTDAKAVSPLRSDAMAHADILACYVAVVSKIDSPPDSHAIPRRNSSGFPH